MIIKKIIEILKNKPYKIAYKINNESITYKELYELANNYANLLSREGTSPVIIYGNKEIDTFISIFACIFANRAYVPIGLHTPINRLEKIVEITDSTLILTNENVSISNVKCLKLKELSKYEKHVINKIENDIVYIIFTSGTTGDPKGVPISKDNLNNFIKWISNLKPLSQYKDSIVLNQANFSFDLSVADIFYSICNGHTLIAFDSNTSKNHLNVLTVFKKEKINVAVMTPTFVKLCLLDDGFNEKKYNHLKCLYLCGEKLEIKTVQKIYERFPNISIINAYGPTEATSAVSGILITKEMLKEEQILPVGEMNNNATDIFIESGEIILKGKSVFGGYLNNYVGGYYKENNINCYKTGDLGFIKDNKLYCSGRKDSQIKYKGYRIELSDIENNIKKIYGVKECVVIARYNKESSLVNTIQAFVEVIDKKYNEEYIIGKLKNLIPNYMIPRTIRIIKNIPINENGKVDRKALLNL